jgi:hypothetical protein
MSFFPKDSLAGQQHREKGLSDKDLWKQPFALLLKGHPHNQKKYKGKKKKVPDIGFFISGSVIVSCKAANLLRDELEKFGVLHEFTVEGERWYSYEVTNVLIGVVDLGKSRYSRSGTFIEASFHGEKLPSETQIFKIPENNLDTIYFNDPEDGSDTILTMAEKHGLEIGETPLVWDSSLSELMNGRA